MINISNQIHLVQTDIWNNFKKEYGNKIEKFEDIYFLVKKIPLSSFYMAYSPKVNFEIQQVDFEKLRQFCKKNKIAFVRFDVPNLLKDVENGKKWMVKLEKECIVASKNTFTKKNIYLDLNLKLEDIVQKMHQKKRYNIKQAQKKNVEIKIESTSEAFENFWQLHSETAKNQQFLTHSKNYFQTLFTKMQKNIYFVQAFVDKNIATCWMIIFKDNTIYYVYGGSNTKYNNYYPSDLVGFEAIKLGKSLGATLFDMWGAEEGKGFTDFKLKYGGEMIEYIDGYDFVVNKFWYLWFNFLYNSFWYFEKLKRKVFKR